MEASSAKRSRLNDVSESVSRVSKRVKQGAEESDEDGTLVDYGIDSPYCAAKPNKYRCRFRNICDPCFDGSERCFHHEEPRLTLLLVGHNPSDHAWSTGWNYGNPTNNMWKLLTGTYGPGYEGCLPKDLPITAQNILPGTYGIGFTPIALLPGNDASEFSDTTMRKSIPNFLDRIHAHVRRVRNGELQNGKLLASKPYGSPGIVAFTGRRQAVLTLNLGKQSAKKINYGRIPIDIIPTAWPFWQSQIWVLPSSSGRAVFKTHQRAEPYQMLALEYSRLKGC